MCADEEKVSQRSAHDLPKSMKIEDYHRPGVQCEPAIEALSSGIDFLCPGPLQRVSNQSLKSGSFPLGVAGAAREVARRVPGGSGELLGIQNLSNLVVL